MKKIIGLAVLLAFCMLTNARAQERKLSEQEMADVKKKAVEKLIAQRLRMKTKTKDGSGFERGRYRNFESMKEFSPEGMRLVIESKTQEGAVQKELIIVGTRRFARSGNGKWEESLATTDRTRELAVLLSNDFDRVSSDEKKKEEMDQKTFEYKFLGQKVVNKQTVDLYEDRRTIKSPLENRVLKDSSIVRFWINQDGLILKVEHRVEIGGELQMESVSEIEYDPAIRIEAPIK